MTYNPNVPNAAQSPGLFPAQNNTNFARLKTIINADHVFNDTAAATDGIHRQVTMVSRADPGALTAGNAILYTKVSSGLSQLFFYNGTSVQQITPQVPIVRACVNFNNAGTIRSQFNVTSVTRNSTGYYRITFTNAMPNTNYIVQITGQRQNFGEVSNGCVVGGATFSGSATTTTLDVHFFGSSTSLTDITAGCVTILSVT